MKECGNMKKDKLLQKAHKNVSNKALHRKINYRVTSLHFLQRKVRRTCGKSFAPPQKISKATVTQEAKYAHQTSYITTFAAKERIPKENHVFLWAAFFGTFFAERKKSTRCPTAGILRKCRSLELHFRGVPALRDFRAAALPRQFP